MTDAEYKLWRGGIAYAEQLLGDLGYNEFSEGRLMGYVPSLSFYLLHVL